jgi:membrane associated rhomboid family serine protease
LVKCANCGAENRDGLYFCSNCGSRLDPANDPNVKRCAFCSKPLVGEESYYFHCKYCGQDFCSEHRLPEAHLCKSNPIRRTLPSTSTPYYSTGGGYSMPTYRPRSSFGLNFSKPGRNLMILIVSGLLIGFLTSLFSVDGISFVYFLVQVNSLVFQGFGIPSLVTSMIVVLPPIALFQYTFLGVEDVFFNAISIFFVDSLLRNTYSPKQYYTVFLLTGLAGNILSLFGEPLYVISFGASGGIFGLVAGAVSADYALNKRVNTWLVMWFVFIFIYSTFAGPVDIFAHLGGAATGLLAGYLIGRSRSRPSRSYN